MNLTTNTPGYNRRLSVWFTTDRRNRRVAYYWSFGANRSIRVGLAAAELWVAQDQATEIPAPSFR